MEEFTRGSTHPKSTFYVISKNKSPRLKLKVENTYKKVKPWNTRKAGVIPAIQFMYPIKFNVYNSVVHP